MINFGDPRALLHNSKRQLVSAGVYLINTEERVARHEGPVIPFVHSARDVIEGSWPTRVKVSCWGMMDDEEKTRDELLSGLVKCDNGLLN